MRGTFYLRSRTFYHHLNQMRKLLQSTECHDDPQTSTDGSRQLPLPASGDDAQDQKGCGINPENCREKDKCIKDGQCAPLQTNSKVWEDPREDLCSCIRVKAGSPRDEGDQGSSSSSLLPGLPNEMTIDHILTKLPWNTLFFNLAAVSRAWRQAVRSHQVHEARTRINTAQSLIAIIHQTLIRKKGSCLAYRNPNNDDNSDDFEHALAISLYDPALDRWYLLPSIEGVDRGIPYACECVCLEGMVYVFGGYLNFYPTDGVYVLDLAAGLGVWRRCLNMRSPRVGFSGGAMDGKIFIFGGTRSGPFENSSECFEAEVFDPKKNTWTPISPTLHRHSSHSVACLEGEFIVHGGRCWTDMDSDDDTDNWLHSSRRIAGRRAEAYNPNKDEWCEVKSFALGIVGTPVVVEGKLHIVSERDSSIYVYDKQSNSWAASQTISWQGLRGGFGRNGSSRGGSSNVVIEATDWEGEILAAMCSWNVARFRSGLEHWEDQIVLLKSRGLGCTERNLEWERIASADKFHDQILCMRPIQL